MVEYEATACGWSAQTERTAEILELKIPSKTTF